MYVHPLGDTSSCKVIALGSKGDLWVEFEKDKFINWWPSEKYFFKRAIKTKPPEDVAEGLDVIRR